MTRDRLVVTSGYYDPIHRGHIECMKLASKLGDRLVVIMNSDAQVLRKYGYILQPMEERIARIKKKAPFVADFVISIDKDSTQTETIRMLRPSVFAKGGDRFFTNMPQSELDACKEVDCEIVYGVGEKVCPSSDMRERIERMRQNAKAR
jgi:D-beta-D-heptose 7-phosphate kinase/D-beta-D-heptose 1-phosphate adenosyltransferase